MKAVYNGGEVDVEVSDKAVIIDTGNDIIGFDLPAVRAVKKRDSGEIVIAYSTGSELKSIALKPLDDSDRANLLLVLTQNQQTQKVVPDTVIDEEFERLYQKWKNRFERELQLAREGKFRMERQELEEYDRDNGTMDDMLYAKFNIDPDEYIQIWKIPNMPYEFQVGWAKIWYLRFLHSLIEIASDPNPYDRYLNLDIPGDPYKAFTRYLKPSMNFGHGLTAEDYERMFIHYGIIDKPIMDEELKKKVKAAERVELVTFGEEPPPDYKPWF